MGERDADFVLRYLAEVEALAEEVMAGRQQIVDLDQKRNQNREALTALSKEVDATDQELLDEEIAKLREELKVKVNNLLEAQGKPELKGYNLKPLNTEEMLFMRKVVEG
ncbi:p53 and DNA damage-regulated protein 1 isoform X2 [Varanus komodoensis]|uniref:p53 and DNA damage-regulated protein 1 isoform X2 n=1 Tax=Varanus komodoensis TaxID=61221 RepID=UPI001CF7E428|nr:p53 and DNA damage-regulated protein 1 isoform X2 [Varanus komodoensis]